MEVLNKYKKIEFSIGCNIDKAVRKLEEYKEKGELVCGQFSGHMLYSDIDDLNSAYIKIVGRTKSEYEDEMERRRFIQNFID